MRQAYDYWQDQPGSPRRGTAESSERGFHTTHTDQQNPRPAFDTRPHTRLHLSIQTRRDRANSPEVQSNGRFYTTKSLITNATTRVLNTRDDAHCTPDARPTTRASSDERHIKQPLRERSPMLSHGSTSHPIDTTCRNDTLEPQKVRPNARRRSDGRRCHREPAERPARRTARLN